MGGAEKGLVLLDGRPLVAHVLERLAPQVAAVAINSNADPALYAGFGLDVIADRFSGRPGPAAGIEAALTWAAAQGFAQVAIVPCDAPAFPSDLVARLAEAGPAAVASHAGQIEPLFSLWPVASASDISRAVSEDPSVAPRRLLAMLGAVQVAFAAHAPGVSPFANLNDRVAVSVFGRSEC